MFQRIIPIILMALLLCVQSNAQEFSLINDNTPNVRTRTALPPQPIGPIRAQAEDDEDLPIQPPEIVGDGDYEIGDLVALSIKPTTPPANFHSVVYSWTILPELEITEWPDGSRIFFGTGRIARTLNIILTASYVFVDMDENNVILNVSQGAITVKTTVRISGGGTVEPGPGPGPVDPVEPTFNNPLAKNSYDWTKSVKIIAGFNQTQRLEDAAALNVAFLQIQERIANQEFTGRNAITKIFEESKILNDKALGARKVHWQPWFTEMTNYLTKAFNDKILTTPAEFAVAWGQIAEGLAAAK